LPFFGLNMGATSAAEGGLTGLLASMSRRAAARACMNHCPPVWSSADPSLGTLGKITGPGFAVGACGAGLAIGRIALGSTGNASGWRRILQSLSIRPAPGGIGLAISF
jgi:hypothetical protein